MTDKNVGETKKTKDVKKFAEEELRLRDQTLSRTAPDTDKEFKEFETVLVPESGGMTSAGKGAETRISPPSGKDIDRETLELRDRTLRATPSDIDPKVKKIKQLVVPETGGKQ